MELFSLFCTKEKLKHKLTTMNTRFFFSIILIFFHQFLFAQNLPRNAEPGKCYAQSMILEWEEEKEMILPVYYGDDKKGIDLDSLYFFVEEQSGKLIYLENKLVRSSPIWKNCKKEDYEKIIILKDTTQIKDFIIEAINYVEIKNSYTEWKEVLCSQEITANTFRNIRDALNKAGFISDENKELMSDFEIKRALTMYQRINNLPIGQLDKETLRALKIIF